MVGKEWEKTLLTIRINKTNRSSDSKLSLVLMAAPLIITTLCPSRLLSSTIMIRFTLPTAILTPTLIAKNIWIQSALFRIKIK